MKTEAAPASFLYCPTKSSQSLAPGGDLLFGPAQLKVRAGKVVDPKPLASCFLPQVVRVAVASQQHYGVSMTRGLKDASEPKLTPPDQWPAAAAAEAAVFSKALAADPDDAGALVGRAAVFENHKLLANALADYKKVGNQWKDAVWIKGKIFELSESLADAAAAAAAADTGGRQDFRAADRRFQVSAPAQGSVAAVRRGRRHPVREARAQPARREPAAGKCPAAHRREGDHGRHAQRVPDLPQGPRHQERHRSDPDRRPRHGGIARQQEGLHSDARQRSAGSGRGPPCPWAKCRR